MDHNVKKYLTWQGAIPINTLDLLKYTFNIRKTYNEMVEEAIVFDNMRIYCLPKSNNLEYIVLEDSLVDDISVPLIVQCSDLYKHKVECICNAIDLLFLTNHLGENISEFKISMHSFDEIIANGDKETKKIVKWYQDRLLEFDRRCTSSN